MSNFMRAFRRCSYVAAFLVFLPPPLRIFIAALLLLAYYIDTCHCNRAYQRLHASAYQGTSVDEVLAVHTLPVSVAVLLILDYSPLLVSARSLVRKKQLIMSCKAWIVQDSTCEHASIGDIMLAIIILLLVVGPTLAIIMLPFSLYLNLCMFITQMSLLLLSREIVNRSLREDYLNAVVYGNKRNLKTYVSYLPREGVPAFARRTLRQQEIYLAAREVYNAAPVVVQVLQAHEQGHIALGHTNWVFYLRKLRALAVAGALLVLLSFYHTLTGVSGPGAALILGGGIFLCIAPELFQFLWQGKWERGADTWAAAYVGQGNVHFVRMALRQALS